MPAQLRGCVRVIECGRGGEVTGVQYVSKLSRACASLCVRVRVSVGVEVERDTEREEVSLCLSVCLSIVNACVCLGVRECVRTRRVCVCA